MLTYIFKSVFVHRYRYVKCFCSVVFYQVLTYTAFGNNFKLLLDRVYVQNFDSIFTIFKCIK